jgi:hypothetical protein
LLDRFSFLRKCSCLRSGISIVKRLPLMSSSFRFLNRCRPGSSVMLRSENLREMCYYGF